MHKTHFWPKKQCKFFFFFTDLPTLFFFQTVTGNKPYFFLGLITLFHYFYCFSRYLSFHIAYYNENKVLVTHPLSTAEHYLKSNFLLDLLSCFPFEIFAYAAVPNFSGRNFVHYLSHKILVSHWIIVIRTVIDTVLIDEPARNPCRLSILWTSQEIDSYVNLVW